MDPRCRIYNDKFPLRIEPTLYSVPSIIYVPVNQRSQCGVCIADRDIIEIILRPFRWSNNSCNVFTQERIDARSQPPFSPLNVIINLGSEQCKRFFFFFFSPFFFFSSITVCLYVYFTLNIRYVKIDRETIPGSFGKKKVIYASN